MEVELLNVHRATSSDCWSLASNQYPSGKFPKVSIGIVIPKTGSGSRRDAAVIPNLERKLSQGTDGGPRESKDDKASAWVSRKPANNDGSAKGTPEAAFGKRASVVQLDNNTPEQLGTFSFGTRREQGGHLDQVEKAALNTPERTMLDRDKCQEDLSGKGKSNNEVLRMKLWEILGGSSQNKQAVASPNKRNSQNANLTKSKPFSDPIETISDSPNQVKRRPVTRSLARKKQTLVAACKQQGKNPSAKKTLPSFSSGTKQKPHNNIFVFDDEKVAKSVGKAANGQSGSYKNQRSSNKKAKIEPQKINFSERISDKTTQDDGDANLPSSEKALSKSKENVSFSSFSRTGKAPQCYSNSFKRERSLNTMAKIEPLKMHFSEQISDKTMQDDGEEKRSSPKKIASKSKENCSFSSLPRQVEKDPLLTPEASNRSLHSHRATEKFFNSPPLSSATGTRGYAASPSPEVKTYPWEQAASPEINDLSREKKVASPLVDRFRNTPDNFPSPTFAMNVDTSLQRSKSLEDAFYSPKYPNSLDRSRSGSFASDPDSESLDDMYENNELHRMKATCSTEERENDRQPPLSPMEYEGTKSFVPNFMKGSRSGKWLPDFESPDKSSFTVHSRKEAHLKDAGKRNLCSPTPFAAARTEETNTSVKESEECPQNSLARAVRQLIAVLESFKTKIKSQTAKKSSEILAATVEKIHQHLEGAEFHMQTDVDKLICAGKSKRKRLESTFQEQQEKLKTVHEKFREEVNQHLLECRRSLEDFEGYHVELKGTADKQKASHRKLLLHVEEAIGAQLNDAEIKIAEVQKGARKKMNGLKCVLKEFVAEAAD